jgi:hypothetical protein
MGTGAPGALANIDCCDGFEAEFLGGQENAVQDAVNNKVNSVKRPIVAGILVVNADLLSSRT